MKIEKNNEISIFYVCYIHHHQATNCNLVTNIISNVFALTAHAVMGCLIQAKSHYTVNTSTGK